MLLCRHIRGRRSVGYVSGRTVKGGMEWDDGAQRGGMAYWEGPVRCDGVGAFRVQLEVICEAAAGRSAAVANLHEEADPLVSEIFCFVGGQAAVAVFVAVRGSIISLCYSAEGNGRERKKRKGEDGKTVDCFATRMAFLGL
jgi:hypothetical protein